MPHFNSINFYQNKSKIKLFLPKTYKIFEHSDPVPPAAGGSTPAQAFNFPDLKSSGQPMHDDVTTF